MLVCYVVDTRWREIKAERWRELSSVFLNVNERCHQVSSVGV